MLDSPAVAAALAGSDLAYVAVESRSGPMVTPLLFAVDDGRLWMVMPSSSAKVDAINRNATVGVTVGAADGDAAVVQGPANLVDPLDPRSLLSSIPDTLRSPRAVGSYVAGNLRHLAGMIGPAALAPRTLAAVRPRRVLAHRAADGAVVEASGWDDPSRVPTDGAIGSPSDGRGGAPTGIVGLPPDLAALPSRAMPVIVGWTSPAGPLALPASWDPERRRATMPAALFTVTGCAPSGPACVLFDATLGTSLAGKAGLVLRGEGTARPGDGGRVAVDVDVTRATWWQGTTSRTEKLPLSG